MALKNIKEYIINRTWLAQVLIVHLLARGVCILQKFYKLSLDYIIFLFHLDSEDYDLLLGFFKEVRNAFFALLRQLIAYIISTLNLIFLPRKFLSVSVPDRVLKPYQFLLWGVFWYTMFYILLWPDSPISKFELPAPLKIFLSLAGLVPTGLPLIFLIVFLLNTIAPYIIFKLLKKEVSFVSLTRYFSYSYASIILVAVIASSFLSYYINFLDIDRNYYKMLSFAFFLIIFLWQVNVLALISGQSRKLSALVLSFTGLIVSPFPSLLLVNYKTPTSGMEPSLRLFDMVLVNKIVYSFRDPKRGEIIAFNSPEENNVVYIKRVIGIPGDHISISGGTIKVNGKESLNAFIGEYSYKYNDRKVDAEMYSEVFFDSSYSYRIIRIMKQQYIENIDAIIPDNQYFFIGDNRDFSKDSRTFGSVKRNRLIGHVYYRYWPLGQSDINIYKDIK